MGLALFSRAPVLAAAVSQLVFVERGFMETQEHDPIHITLSKAIAALQIPDAGTNGEKPGVISQLPKGAELEVCGSGFTSGTRKVAFGGHFYFIFLQDIEELQQSGGLSWSIG